MSDLQTVREELEKYKRIVEVAVRDTDHHKSCIAAITILTDLESKVPEGLGDFKNNRVIDNNISCLSGYEARAIFEAATILHNFIHGEKK